LIRKPEPIDKTACPNEAFMMSWKFCGLHWTVPGLHRSLWKLPTGTTTVLPRRVVPTYWCALALVAGNELLPPTELLPINLSRPLKARLPLLLTLGVSVERSTSLGLSALWQQREIQNFHYCFYSTLMNPNWQNITDFVTVTVDVYESFGSIPWKHIWIKVINTSDIINRIGFLEPS
jgi:hypothetical protein